MGKTTDPASQQANFAAFMGRLASLPDGQAFDSLPDAQKAGAFKLLTFKLINDKELNKDISPMIGSLYFALSKEVKAQQGAAPIRSVRGELMAKFVAKMGFDYDSGKKLEAEQPLISKTGNEEEAPAKSRRSHAAAQQIKVDDIGDYKYSFLLLISKFAKLKDHNQFDMLLNRKRQAIFKNPLLRAFLESPKENRNLPRGAKISGLMHIVKEKLRAGGKRKRGSALPTMILLFGYDPETGEIIANRKVEVQLKRTSALGNGGPTFEDVSASPILAIVGAASESMARAINECSSIIDCGKSYEFIFRALSETEVGRTQVLYLARKPDRQFLKALALMGFHVVESYSKPQYHELTGLQYDGTHLLVAKRVDGVCNATPIMLANGCTRKAVILDEMHRLLDLAPSAAKTTGDVGKLHGIADDLLSLLKKEKKAALSEKVLEAFTAVEGKKIKGDASDPAILKMAKEKMRNPAINKIGLATQRKEGFKTVKVFSKR